ncbi:MAG: hypothetical protein R2742_07720 [Micropruina glycogenica]
MRQGSRWCVDHCRARRASNALPRTSPLRAELSTRPSSSSTRLVLSDDRSRWSSTVSRLTSGAIGRDT